MTKDLPGYYFDPEKNRYFRLLPGHNNCNPLTKENIQQKEMEHKRLQLLEEEDKQKKVGSTFLGAALPPPLLPPSTADSRCQLNALLRLSTVHFRECVVFLDRNQKKRIRISKKSSAPLFLLAKFHQ